MAEKIGEHGTIQSTVQNSIVPMSLSLLFDDEINIMFFKKTGKLYPHHGPMIEVVLYIFLKFTLIYLFTHPDVNKYSALITRYAQIIFFCTDKEKKEKRKTYVPWMHGKVCLTHLIEIVSVNCQYIQQL